MKKTLFKGLAKLNKAIMPSFAQKDLTKLSKFQKLLVGYRYWVTINAIDN